MADFQIDHASGVRLIGAEMLFQSELTEVGDPSAIVDLLASMRRTREASRILLLGPRAALLLRDLPTEAHVDVLVRGLPDARVIAAERMMHRTLTLWCGGLDRYDTDERYDLIIMLDETSRLLTPDSRPLANVDLLQHVGGWLADDGLLVAQAANAFSTESLLELRMEPTKLSDQRFAYAMGPLDDDSERPDTGDGENENWWRGATGFSQRPLFWSELESAVAKSSLAWDATFAAYPSHDYTALLVNREDASPMRKSALAHAVRVQDDLPNRRPYLQEPTQLVADAITAGQLVGLAPSWLVLLRKGAAGGRSEVPALVVNDIGVSQRWHRPLIALSDPDDYLWTLGRDDALMQSGQLRRTFTAQQASASVSPFSLALRGALIGGNMLTIRNLVQEYTDWLTTLKPQEGLFATPNNVSYDGTTFEVLDTSWSWQGQVPSDIVVLYCLRHFARRALRAGVAHPWAPDVSPDKMTESLAAMAGRGSSPTDLLQAAYLEAEIEVALYDVPSDQMKSYIADSVTDGQSAMSAAVGGGMGFRDLASRAARLSIALQTRAEQVQWLEVSLRNRTLKLEKAERRAADLRNSLSFKVGRALTSPIRRPVAFLKSRISPKR